MTARTIGFVGAGNMARSIIGGLVASGVDPQLVSIFDAAEEQRAAALRDFGVRVEADNVGVASKCDVLVLAVKPMYMRDVAEEVRPAIATRRPLVISVAAGVRIEALTKWLGDYSTIVRTMPNRPALMRKGITALYATPDVGAEHRQVAEALMASVGLTAWVEREDLLDAVTAVSGSGPAYFFLLIELLEEAARELGLADETARTLAIETAYGAAAMAHTRQETPEALRGQVTSRGGTTAAALQVLEEANLRGIVIRAVKAACRRSAEMAAESTRPGPGR